MDESVESLFHKFLRLVASQLGDPGVEEDQLEVKTGPEHEHVAEEAYLGGRAAGQRVTNGDQADVLLVVVLTCVVAVVVVGGAVAVVVAAARGGWV